MTDVGHKSHRRSAACAEVLPASRTQNSKQFRPHILAIQQVTIAFWQRTMLTSNLFLKLTTGIYHVKAIPLQAWTEG